MRNPKDIMHNEKSLDEWLEINREKNADLSGADLRGADLSGADLRGADLRGADLSWADLSGADLRGANLSWADLRGADLSWADFRRADLSGTDLSWADLRGAVGDYSLFFGGKHHAWATVDRIVVGCEVHTHEHWRDNYIEIGRKNEYTEEEIERYGQWIKGLDWLIEKDKEQK